MNGDDIDVDVTMAGGAGGDLLANRYRIVKQLGQGGMGSVWLAEDTQLDNKPFAIKMLPSVLVSNSRAYRQLKDEALVAMKLTHPNIVTLRAFEENDGNPFLVMDYVEGQTLDNCLEGWGNLSVEEAAALLKPIAEALDYAHSQGVVHRDVKPGNVMVRSDGVPFILDFGIAREVQESMTHITGRQSSGTLLYMSPEQLNGDAPRPAQDVYSFAAMAYECIKGAAPFSRGNVEYQIMNNVPEPLSEGGEAPTPLVAGIMAGLSKNPEERPESCMAVIAGGDLSRPAAEGTPASQPEVVSSATSGGAPRKRWWSDIPKTPVAVILTVLLMLGAFVCKQYMSGKNTVSAPAIAGSSENRSVANGVEPSPSSVPEHVAESSKTGKQTHLAKVAEKPWVPGPTDGLVLSPDGKTFISAPKGLKSVAIPDGVTKIADRAFADQKELMYVSIPPSVTEIGTDVFNGCGKLSGIYISDLAAWCKIPFVAWDLQPLHGRSLFLDGCCVEDLVIPQGVTSIGDNAFRGCISIQRAKIPGSVVDIRSRAFAECSNLGEFIVADDSQHYRSVDGLLFTKDMRTLVAVPAAKKDVSIPDSVEVVCDVAARSSGLTHLTIPRRVRQIGVQAFADCHNLIHIEVARENRHFKSEDGLLLTKDGKTLISVPGGLVSAKISSGVETIESYAAFGCKSLTSVDIPSGVKHIGPSAFAGAGIEKVTIPDGVTLIDERVFNDCRELAAISIPNSVKLLKYRAFGSCVKLEKITVPGSVEDIGLNAFMWSGLKDVAIQEGVKNLGPGAFRGTKIKSIIIPGSVTNISECAFKACKQLESVTIPEGLTNIAENAFEGCDKLLDANGKPRLIRVPRGANKSAPSGNSNSAPTVKIVATVSGREVKGAKVRVGTKDHLVPVTWNVKNGASYGPYDVSYENGGRRYRGTFGKVTVDWRGEKTFRVPLELRGSSK